MFNEKELLEMILAELKSISLDLQEQNRILLRLAQEDQAIRLSAK